MSDSTANVYTFTFEVIKRKEQVHSVVGTDRDAALAFATKMQQAELRGEPDWDINLIEETATPKTENNASNTKRPLGDGEKDIYGRRRSN